MLPVGHIAAGYLVAHKLLQNMPGLSDFQHGLILFFGMFWAFAPDLDMFFSFAKAHSFTLNKAMPDHRSYISHSPPLWILAGAIVWPLLESDFSRLLFLTALFAAMSHFILDSIQVGVMWAWPVSHKKYALLKGEPQMKNKPSKFIKFWIEFVKFYATKLTVTFVAEIFVIFAALLVAFV